METCVLLLDQLYEKETTFTIRDEKTKIVFECESGNITLMKLPMPAIPLIAYIVPADHIKANTWFNKELNQFNARVLYDALEFLALSRFLETPRPDDIQPLLFARSVDIANLNTLIPQQVSILVNKTGININHQGTNFHLFHQPTSPFGYADETLYFLDALPEILECLIGIASYHQTQGLNKRFSDLMYYHGEEGDLVFRSATTTLSLFAEHFVKQSSPLVLPLLSRDGFTPDRPLDLLNRTYLENYF